MDDIKTTILGIVEREFGTSIVEAMKAGGKVFVDHGGPIPLEGDYLDSLDRTELVMAVEDEFSIDIPDSISVGFKTLDQIVDYVAALTSKPLHGDR